MIDNVEAPITSSRSHKKYMFAAAGKWRQLINRLKRVPLIDHIVIAITT